MAYKLEERARAKALFVEAQVPYEQIAEETGIGIASLKVWGGEENWMEERRQFERQFLEINGKLQKLKGKLLDDAYSSGDSQKIYALTNLIRATARPGANGKTENRAALFLEFLQQEIDFLKGRDTEALRYLQPHMKAFAEHVKTAAAEG